MTLAVLWIILVALFVGAIIVDDLPNRRRTFQPPDDDLARRREPRQPTDNWLDYIA
jgi:hypothetical protein